MSTTKESLFSKKNMKLIKDPLNDSNPVSIQVLGICSALAITIMLENAFVMSMSVLFVLIAANVVVSSIRNLIPDKIRIIVQLVIVATLVITVDLVLKAFVYEVSKQLSVFVGLIITNCIIMGRLEAFALANKPGPAFLDAIGNAFGYTWILLVVGFIREIFGSGSIWGVKIVPDSLLIENGGFYEHNGLMLLSPIALFLVASIIWVQRSKNRKLIEAN
ncbi:NADH:ubiquinone reductase (Na(+)-transporting) subunit D [Flavobacteriales bacterium]|jgi:Na+-transporting NADH:ubiquinone oxidoreductase subunit D|nr:NADH:ubiquinone reductase (Na(+)-transporting) subunit D [Flavobacteriales bacterium]MDG1518453.1 NADH:ubiquinone reductase (Na(+)-transporting) subunit D [Flavobacteriales bacterium]